VVLKLKKETNIVPIVVKNCNLKFLPSKILFLSYNNSRMQGGFIMPETTDRFHRVPTGKRKKKNSEIRTISIGKGIKALYDIKNKVIVTYLFDVKKYTMKQAKKWVKDHKNEKSFTIMAENTYLIDKSIEKAKQDKQKVFDIVIDKFNE